MARSHVRSPDRQPGLGFHARERRRRKPASDFPCSLEVHPDWICAREQLRGMLYQAVQALPARHQQVVQPYYTDQKTMREIGRLLGVNESRVSQIHKTALTPMAATPAASEITSSRMF